MRLFVYISALFFLFSIDTKAQQNSGGVEGDDLLVSNLGLDNGSFIRVRQVDLEKHEASN